MDVFSLSQLKELRELFSVPWWQTAAIACIGGIIAIIGSIVLERFKYKYNQYNLTMKNAYESCMEFYTRMHDCIVKYKIEISTGKILIDSQKELYKIHKYNIKISHLCKDDICVKARELTTILTIIFMGNVDNDYIKKNYSPWLNSKENTQSIPECLCEIAEAMLLDLEKCIRIHFSRFTTKK